MLPQLPAPSRASRLARLFVIHSLLLTLCAAFGCKRTVIDATLTGPDLTPTFAADVAPVLQSRCTPCHIGLRTSGVEMTTYTLLSTSVGQQYGIAIVQPGDADGSPIIDKISNDNPAHGVRMPQGLPPLSAAQIQTIREWIDAGANDD